MSNQNDRAQEIKKLLDSVRRSSPTYIDMQRFMTRYAIERFLYRLGRSRYEQSFVLKGAMLLAIYAPSTLRSTRDADFLLFGAYTEALIKEVLSEICYIECDDGLTFDTSAIVVASAGRDRQYPGYEAKIPARLGTSNCDVSLDIGFGESVIPPAKHAIFPSLLTLPNPEVRVYPLETIVAEKFQAIVHLGLSNSRLKDYHDLSQFAQICEIDGRTLSEAVRATFQRRRTVLPTEMPIGLTSEFYHLKRKQTDWNVFLKRISLSKGLTLEHAYHMIDAMVMPVSRACSANEPFQLIWKQAAWHSE